MEESTVQAALSQERARTRDTWGQTAAQSGLPADDGERVWRKLKRLGDQHTARGWEPA